QVSVMNIRNEPKPCVIVGMVKNDTAIFPLGCPQSPSNHLDKQHFGTSGASQNDAANIPVNAGREATYVCDNANLAAIKLALDNLAICHFGVSVDVAAPYPCPLELGL